MKSGFFSKTLLSLSVLVFALSFFSCKTETVVEVQSVTVTFEKEGDIYEGDTFVAKATVLPENAADKSVKWSSGNDEIAEIDSKGNITAVSEGSTVIYATAGGVKGSKEITVLKEKTDTETPDTDDGKQDQGTSGDSGSGSGDSGSGSESGSGSGSGDSGSGSGDSGSGSESGSDTGDKTEENTNTVDGFSILKTDTYFAPGWSQQSVNIEGYLSSGFTYVLSEKTSEMWQAQAKFYTDTDISSGDTYEFSVTLNSTADLSNVVLKFDDTDQIEYHTDISLKAGEDKVVKYSGTSSVTKSDVVIVFDFGNNPASTVTFKNLSLKVTKSSGSSSESGGTSGETSGEATPSSIPSVTIPSGAKVIFDSASAVDKFGTKTWADDVLSETTINGSKVKVVNATDSMTYKYGVYAIEAQEFSAGSTLYMSVYSSSNIKYAPAAGGSYDSVSSISDSGTYKWRTISKTFDGLTTTSAFVLGSETSQTYYISSIYIVDPSSSGSSGGSSGDSGSGGTSGETSSGPSSSPSVTIPGGAIVIYDSAKNTDLLKNTTPSYGNATMASYSAGSSSVKMITIPSSNYGVFSLSSTKSFNSSSKLYAHVYACHNFKINPNPGEGDISITVIKDGNWEWKSIELDLGSQDKISQIAFASDTAQTIYVDHLYIVNAGADSSNISSIVISGNDSVKESTQIALKATLKKTDGTESDATTSVEWTSSNTSIAIISGRGTVTGLSTGSVTITASYGSVSATKTITVTEDVDPESKVTSSSQITTTSSIATPFGVVVNDNKADGKFNICFGAPSSFPSYWVLFVTSSSGQEKKVKLTTCGVTNVKVAYGAGTYSLKLYAVVNSNDNLTYSEPWTGSIYVSTSSSSKTLPSDADARLANRTLVEKKDNTFLTMQFENNTGKFSDDQIWITGFGLNDNNEWCYLSSTGTAIPIEEGSTSADWSFRLSDVSTKTGLQVKTFASGRIYITCGDSPVHMVANGSGTNIGIAQPNLAALDVDTNNKDKYFDWIEFTSGSAGLFVNTTQVDAFTFPIVVADYSEDGLGGYEWNKSVGIPYSRSEVFSKWNTWTSTYSKFACLNRDGKRILAPCKVSEFDKTYMDSYINEVWEYYKTHDLTYSESEHGTYTGRVYDVKGVDGNTYGVFKFTRAGDNSNFYIYRKPTIQEAFEGSGVLAMDCAPSQSQEWFGTTEYGNTETSKNVQNRICSAFTRHAFVKSGNDFVNYMDNISKYYSEEPANMYSAFWHTIGIDGYAYGFCYDDNHDQSTTTQDSNVYGIVVGIGKWE